MNANRTIALAPAFAVALAAACAVDDVKLTLRKDGGTGVDGALTGSGSGGKDASVVQSGGVPGTAGTSGSGGKNSTGTGGTMGSGAGGSSAGGDMSETGGADAGFDAGVAGGTAVGKLGDPCSPAGASACAGPSQKDVLSCTSGKWASAPACSATTNCDTTAGPSAGSCQPIVTECTGKTPGTTFCRSKERLECGPDLITAKSLETCPFLCTAGACTGECKAGDADCRGGGDAGAGRVPRSCQSDGTWKDGTPCVFLCAAATGSCVAASCGDGVQNGDETDKDCGGSCGATCNVNQKCLQNADCVLPTSGKCTSGKCAAATCSDGVKNGDETDTDCGGSCANKCPVTKHCGASADCLSSACVSGTCTGVCSPGLKTCSGNGVATCNSSGQYDTPVACTSGTQSCQSGACTACASGTANCDSNAADCETNLNSNATCGKSCGATVACGTGQQCSNEACQCTGNATLCGSTCVNVMGSDPANCGACQHSCQSSASGACVAGKCQPILLEKETQPVALAATDLKVFWVGTDGYALSAPVNGGAAANFYVAGNAVDSRLCPTATTCMVNMAIDATTVYWPSMTVAPPDPFIQAQTLGGNSPYAYGNEQNSNGLYTWVVTDATRIYAAYRSYVVPGGGCGGIGVDYMTITPRSTTTSTWTLAAFCRISQMAVDSTNLYWTDLGSPNGTVAPGVFAAPKLGTTSSAIDSASIPKGIAVYGGVVYWTDTGTGAIRSWPKTGTPTTLSSSSAPGPIAVDASGVYWIDSGTTIMRAPLTGTNVTPQTLATGQVAATAITTNTASIFWINTGTSAASYADGAVMKLAK
jgi:hypothetical protein